jgi:2-polyprenyl-6-methoxyphenol hydroxylase-like FAD-dependent oxidoreductase
MNFHDTTDQGGPGAGVILCRARLVVGADGVRSAIRNSLAPNDKMRYLVGDDETTGGR